MAIIEQPREVGSLMTSDESSQLSQLTGHTSAKTTLMTARRKARASVTGSW
jgi:hypothetical protein